MFRLIVVAVAAVFGILYVFGGEERRVEVSRQAADEATGFTLAALELPQIENTLVRTRDFGLSDEEAVRLALKASADIRAGRTSAPLYGVVAAVDAAGISAAAAPISPEQAPSPMWYVTGSSVNLRAGPGTANAVVGRLGYGAQAEVLDDQDGWYQIRTTNGDVSGWIFGKFLADNRPG